MELELLRPWKPAFARLSVTGFVHGEDDAVEIKVDVRPPFDALRQAMELLSAALVLDPALLQRLVVDEWVAADSHSASTDAHSAAAALTEKLGRGVGSISFRVESRGLDVKRICDGLQAILLLHDDSDDDHESAYHCVRKELLLHTMQQNRRHHPEDVVTTIRCAVNSRQASNLYWFQTGDSFYRQLNCSATVQVKKYFDQLAALVHHSRAYRRSPNVGTLVRFELVQVVLDMDAFHPITTHTVQTAKALMLVDDMGRVVCGDVKLDLRAITCGEDELVEFMRVVGRGSPGLRVETGFTSEFSAMEAIDNGGEDQTSRIVAIMRAVAACESLKSVDVGKFLALLSGPRNRECFWHAVLDHLLSPENPSPIGELVLSADAGVTTHDVRVILALPDIASRERRPAHSLHIGPTELPADAILALLALVRDMEALDLSATEAAVPAAIVERCPKLRSLRLCYPTIQSMAVFTDANSGLEELAFFEPVVEDSASVMAFIAELAEPTTRIARTLRSFMLETPYRDGPFFINEPMAEQFKNALRVLRKLDIQLGSDVPEALQRALLGHNGDIVLLTDEDPSHRARQVAFLSVVQARALDSVPRGAMGELDAMLLRVIFAFMAPYAERFVRADYPIQRDRFGGLWGAAEHHGDDGSDDDSDGGA